MKASFVHYKSTDIEQAEIKVVCIQPGLHRIVSIFPNGHEVFLGEVEMIDKRWCGYIYTSKGMGWALGPTGGERLRYHGFRADRDFRYLKDAVNDVVLSTVAYQLYQSA